MRSYDSIVIGEFWRQLVFYFLGAYLVDYFYDKFAPASWPALGYWEAFGLVVGTVLVANLLERVLHRDLSDQFCLIQEMKDDE